MLLYNEKLKEAAMQRLSSFSLSFWTRLSALLILTLIGIGCSRVGTKPVAPPLPIVPAPDLLLDAKPFPQGWQVDPCKPEPCGRGGQAWRYFDRVGMPGHVLQDVYNFGDIEMAKSKYRLYREADFTKSPPPQVPSTDLVAPRDIPYRSPIAEEYYLECGWDIRYVCRALFRYGQYLVEFSCEIDLGDGVGGLKIQEVEPILRAMDEKASSVLALPLTRPIPKTLSPSSPPHGVSTYTSPEVGGYGG